MSGFPLVIHISLATVCSRHPLLEKTLTEKSRRILLWSFYSLVIYLTCFWFVYKMFIMGKCFIALFPNVGKIPKACTNFYQQLFVSLVIHGYSEWIIVFKLCKREDYSTPICEKDDSIVVSRFSFPVGVWLRTGEVEFFSFTRALSRSNSSFNCCLSISDSSRSRVISFLSCKFSFCKSLWMDRSVASAAPQKSG